MAKPATSSLVNVTPKMAAEWLATSNTHNRNVREDKVAGYARDMESGEWLFNGDAIRFALDGTLLDGQHRLISVVRSGVTIPAIVVRGLAPEVQDTIDIGAHRAMRDQLLLRGESNSREVAAIARRMVVMQSSNTKYTPTHAEMFAYIEATPTIRRSAEVAVLARRVPASPSAIGAAYHVCAAKESTAADLFYVTQLIDCVGLQAHSPARALLMRLQKEATSGRQMAADDVYRYAIVAWNAFRSGRSLSKLQAPHGGWTSENEPQPN